MPIGTAGVGAALLIAVASLAAPSGSFANDLLRREGFSPADLRTLDAGEAVVKRSTRRSVRSLRTSGWCTSTPTGLFIDRFGDIERFEGGPGVLQIPLEAEDATRTGRTARLILTHGSHVISSTRWAEG